MRRLEISALVGLVLWGAWALQPGLGSAQAGDEGSEEEQRNAAARSLFADGVTAVHAERWDDAVDLFRRAYALRAAPAIAWNLGTSLVNGGRLVEGSEWVQRVEVDETAPADMRENAAHLIEDLEPRFARLRIELVGPREGVEITLDQRPVPEESFGVPAPADPGEHTLAAAREGEVVASEHFELEEGGSAQITLEIPLPIVDQTPVSGGGSILAEWWFWALIGGGVALGAAITVAIAVGAQGTAEPVQGTTLPPLLVFP